MNEHSFEGYGLSDEILKALNKLNFNTPTKVQNEVIPVASKGRDAIVKSQTGSGKTAAYGIPVCDKVIIEEKEPQSLILTPTRELAVQVKEDITNIGRLKRIRCAAVYGKQPVSIQVRELSQRVHIVAGTPGRTMDLIKRGNLNVEKIKYFIIDEADKMLDMGFIEQVEDIIKSLPRERVTMLFSATMPEEIESLCQKYMNNPVRIDITPENITAQRVEQEWYEAEKDKKFQLLKDIIFIENPESCIIFCNTKDSVDSIAKDLKAAGFSCSALHGGMIQDERLKIMQSFKTGSFDFLIATDVAARGIDIENLTHIINYDVPEEKESYVHRIGRTGRAGLSGRAITLVYPYEIRRLNEIEEYIESTIPKKERPDREQVKNAMEIFRKRKNKVHKAKGMKAVGINSEISKLYIGAGKKKKIRPGDIVGAITSIEGVDADCVGVIDIQDNFTYVDILNGKGNMVLEALNNKTIKGKNVRVQKAEK